MRRLGLFKHSDSLTTGEISNVEKKRDQAFFGLFMMAMAIAFAPAVQAAEGVCDVQSLKGRYGFQASGQINGPAQGEAGATHVAEVGTIKADGEGHAAIQYTESSDKSAPTTTQAGASYTVNPDCTGTLQFLVGGPESEAADQAPGFAFVLKPDHTFSFISTVAGTVLTGSAWQITDTASEPISAGTLGTLYTCGSPGCWPGYYKPKGQNVCVQCPVF
jgi:hypothetical protein